MSKDIEVEGTDRVDNIQEITLLSNGEICYTYQDTRGKLKHSNPNCPKYEGQLND